MRQVKRAKRQAQLNFSHQNLCLELERSFPQKFTRIRRKYF